MYVENIQMHVEKYLCEKTESIKICKMCKKVYRKIC